MLHFNPDKRPTAEECLQHPYFRTLHQPDDEVGYRSVGGEPRAA